MGITDTASRYRADQLHLAKRTQEKLEKLLRTIEKKTIDLDRKDSAATLDAQTLDTLIQALRSNTPLTGRLLRRACFSLAALETHDTDGTYKKRIVHWVSQDIKPRYLNALYAGYLGTYKENDSSSEALRLFLCQHTDRLSRRHQESISAFKLLEPRVAQHIAKHLMQYNDPLTWLNQLKLRRDGQGLSACVFTHVCQAIERELKPVTLNRFLRYVTVEPRSVIYPMNVKPYAHALLRPWVHQPIQDEALKNTIEHFFIETFGDPRIHEARWQAVPDEAMVLKRWLSKQSFEMLMQVLNESNDTGHWEDREPFWQAYFEQGNIDQAWVAFGRSAVKIAERMIHNKTLPPGGFAKLGAGAAGNHSVLLFCIGDLLVTEWTHDGAIRMYGLNASGRPQMYQSKYLVANNYTDEVYLRAKPVDCDEYFTHTHRSWKPMVARAIYERTGVRHPLLH